MKPTQARQALSGASDSALPSHKHPHDYWPCSAYILSPSLEKYRSRPDTLLYAAQLQSTFLLVTVTLCIVSWYHS